MIVWIDTDSGTWGEFDDNLRIVETTKDLDDMSDSQIRKLGMKKGTPVRP